MYETNLTYIRSNFFFRIIKNNNPIKRKEREQIVLYNFFHVLSNYNETYRTTKYFPNINNDHERE